MRVFLTRTRRVLLAGALGLSGCSTPLEPGDVLGTYVLVRLDGRAMPGTVAPVNAIEFQIVYDTLVLRADGTTRVLRLFGGLPPSAGTGFAGGYGSFTLDRTTIALTPPPCGVRFCYPRTLRWVMGELLESDSFLGTLEYRRIGPPTP